MVIPTSVRLDDKLIDRIREDAEKERRSVSKQIEFMLLKYYQYKIIITEKL